jgi:hypothetical protein
MDAEKDISHKDIYDRLIAVELKVVDIDNNTKDLVQGFQAAKGAFTVLEWIARIAKPILWIGGVVGMLGVMWSGFTKK